MSSIEISDPDSVNLLSPRGLTRWMKEVGVPLFIPPQGRTALAHLNVSSPITLLIELQRLSTLGSSWASAALATVLIYPDERGVREISRSKELVMKPAAAGDAYSLYVLAWAELLSGDKSSCFSHLQRSAKSGFSPAILDLAGTFLPDNVGTALRLLKKAEALGHVAARGRILQLWMNGSMGWARRLPGLLWFTLGSMNGFFKLRSDPLSVDTFCIHNRFRTPPIRRLPFPVQ